MKNPMVSSANFFSSGVAAAMLDGEELNTNALRTNKLLRNDEWKQIDLAVVEAQRIRLNAVADLYNRGLSLNIADGLGVMILEWQTMTGKTGGRLDMSPQAQELNDRVKFATKTLPLPVIHDDWQLGIRTLKAGRKKGTPIDTLQASESSKNVAEIIENLLINGSSSYEFDGSIIYGYTDYPDRNQVSLTTAWDDSAMTGALIRDDVLAMKQASINAKYYGPFSLYVPTAYETVLDEDYSTNYGGKTIRQRILDIAGIQSITVNDTLSANNVLLVQMTSNVIRMVNGLPIQNLQWDSKGGMLTNFKVMTIQVPQIRSDSGTNCGVTHLS